jgi:hypothetical protein
MDAVWIQVFVLTLAECVAPAGKTVCQERELDLLFLSGADCEVVLEQLITLKEESPNVIVNRDKSRCAPSARQSDAFASLEGINEAYRDKVGWHLPGPGEAQPAATRVAYKDRLANLKSCEESDGVAPCKIGDIIIEDASGEPVEVWRSDQ